jgi:hypothetical protein
MGVKYGNLLDFLTAKAKEGEFGESGEGNSITESEFRDALLSLENEGKINLVGHRLTPTIRYCNE